MVVGILECKLDGRIFSVSDEKFAQHGHISLDNINGLGVAKTSHEFIPEHLNVFTKPELDATHIHLGIGGAVKHDVLALLRHQHVLHMVVGQHELPVDVLQSLLAVNSLCLHLLFLCKFFLLFIFN